MPQTRVLLFVCLTIIVPGCNIGPTVWTRKVEETRKIEAPGLRKLTVQSHNGFIRAAGDKGTPDVSVKILKKAGGRTIEDAEAALSQLEVYCDESAPGERTLGYRWKVPRQRDWSASVSFELQAPAAVTLDAEAHNGEIIARGFESDVRAVSHNGSVEVESCGSALVAETHNGEINLAYSGPKISAISHNGSIRLDLSKGKAVEGQVSTHNGRITIIAGRDTSADVVASTSNGGISAPASWNLDRSKPNRASGRLGAGGTTLLAKTSNGGIDIRHE